MKKFLILTTIAALLLTSLTFTACFTNCADTAYHTPNLNLEQSTETPDYDPEPVDEIDLDNIPEGYFVARIYADPTAMFYFIYRYELISYENMVEETISKINEFNGYDFPIDNFWYDGTNLIVDLEPDVDIGGVSNFLQGSSGASINVGIIVQTFGSFPNVETVEIRIDGRRGVEGWHFDFSEPFTVSEWR